MDFFRSLRAYILGSLFVILAGCQASQNSEAPKKDAEDAKTPKSSVASSQETVKLPDLVVEVGDENDLKAILEENKGKVVLVDFWGTWCMPCLELLPHTLELGEKYGNEGLVVVTVAIEDLSNLNKVEEVKGVLVKNGASGKIRALVSRYGIGEESFAKFGIASGALPHLKLFSRDGTLVLEFGLDAEKPEPERIDAEIRRLLAEEAASYSEDVIGPELVVPESHSAVSLTRDKPT